MKFALKQLLDELDTIEETYAEVGDTDVREQMYEAVFHAFIARTPGYALPATFGLFEHSGNAVVHQALTDFIQAARQAGASTPQARFASFQDASVFSDSGSTYDDYFGHAESYAQLSMMMSQTALCSTAEPSRKWWKFWK